jgi:hypothetical protein
MRRVLVLVVTAVVVGLSMLAANASAANQHASCKGILVSSLAGEPGEVAEATRSIHEIVKGLELPLGVGVHVSAAAGHLHEDDVVACLEALGF